MRDHNVTTTPIAWVSQNAPQDGAPDALITVPYPSNPAWISDAILTSIVLEKSMLAYYLIENHVHILPPLHVNEILRALLDNLGGRRRMLIPPTTNAISALIKCQPQVTSAIAATSDWEGKAWIALLETEELRPFVHATLKNKAVRSSDWRTIMEHLFKARPKSHILQPSQNALHAQWWLQELPVVHWWSALTEKDQQSLAAEAFRPEGLQAANENTIAFISANNPQAVQMAFDMVMRLHVSEISSPLVRNRRNTKNVLHNINLLVPRLSPSQCELLAANLLPELLQQSDILRSHLSRQAISHAVLTHSGHQRAANKNKKM